MSNYTTEIRWIVEQTAVNKGVDVKNSSINKIIDSALPFVFDFSFPIFDQSYRDVLCTKILKHYYTREIGFETVALWKFKLDTKLNEIMPYYNKLYNTELIEFNPLVDVDYYTTHQGTGTSNSVENGQSTSETLTGETGSFKKSSYGSSSSKNDGSYSETKISDKNGSVNSTDSKKIDKTIDKTYEDKSALEGENKTTETHTDVTTEGATGQVTVTGKDTTNQSASSSNSATSTGSVETTSGETDKYSDTPQNGLQNVLNNNYLTNARVKDGNENSSNTSSTSGSSENNSYSVADSSKITDTVDDKTTNTTVTKNSTATVDNRETKESTENITESDTEKDVFEQLSKDDETVNTHGESHDTGSGSTELDEQGSDRRDGSVNSSETENQTVDVKTTDDYVNHISGKYPGKSYPQLIQELRDSLLNIDMMIIDELEPLFMQVW